MKNELKDMIEDEIVQMLIRAEKLMGPLEDEQLRHLIGMFIEMQNNTNFAQV